VVGALGEERANGESATWETAPSLGALGTKRANGARADGTVGATGATGALPGAADVGAMGLKGCIGLVGAAFFSASRASVARSAVGIWTGDPATGGG
jgi:hypothetical protein